MHTLYVINVYKVCSYPTCALALLQVVSCLRHKHGVCVEVCSLGQGGGYIISNRAVVERRQPSGRVHAEYALLLYRDNSNSLQVMIIVLLITGYM